MLNNGICHITLDNVAVKLRFGLPAARLFSELLLASDSEKYRTGVLFNEAGIAKILFFGYKNELLVSEEPQKFVYSDFYNMVENAVLSKKEDEIVEAIKIFSESRALSPVLEETVETLETKKKLIGTALKNSAINDLALTKKKSIRSPLRNTSKGLNVTKPKSKKK